MKGARRSYLPEQRRRRTGRKRAAVKAHRQRRRRLTVHVDISKTMARDRLVPAVERADTATGIAATGFSCRSQIKDTTPRTAQHPAEWLCAALPEP